MISNIKRYTFLVGIVKLLREKTSDGNVFSKEHSCTYGYTWGKTALIVQDTCGTLLQMHLMHVLQSNGICDLFRAGLRSRWPPGAPASCTTRIYSTAYQLALPGSIHVTLHWVVRWHFPKLMHCKGHFAITRCAVSAKRPRYHVSGREPKRYCKRAM